MQERKTANCVKRKCNQSNACSLPSKESAIEREKNGLNLFQILINATEKQNTPTSLAKQLNKMTSFAVGI